MKTYRLNPCGLLMILLISFGGMILRSAPVDKPVLGSPNEQTLTERDALNLVWTDPSNRAIWFYVYVQKDGSLYHSQWIRGDEAENQGTYRLPLGEAAPGSYSFWVHGWEPCEGSGDWSNTGQFLVDCKVLSPPAPNFPQGDFSGSWPLWYFSDGVNNTATWSELAVYRGATMVGSQWIEKIAVGDSTVATAREITAFDPHFYDGDYTWMCRDYSPCGGFSQWSPAPLAFAVLNTGCSAPPLPLPIPPVDLYHYPSNTPDAGNRASIIVDHNGDGTAASWSQVYLVEVASGAVIVDEWVYSDLPHPDLPFLAPGDYAVYSRRYHPRCGVGSWTTSPTTFTVTSKTAGPITNMMFRGYDCEGSAYASWDCQVGNDWYQVYILSGGNVVMNQWFDVDDPYSYGPVYPDGDGGLYVISTGPCAGPTDVWVRSYANSGEFGAWTQLTDVGTPGYDPTAPSLSPIIISDNKPTIDWSDSTPYGQYEVYVAREGEYYYGGIIECNDPVPNTLGPDYPPIGMAESEATPFFEFCEGEYTVWVRSLLQGASYGTWSDPLPFTVSRVPQ